jgi:hypothetical protein
MAKERDKNAFLPKFDLDVSVGHIRGCKCKAGCLKKYCDCFSAGVRCGVNCSCTDCKNTEGNPDLERALGLEPGAAKRAKSEESQYHDQKHEYDRSLDHSELPHWLKALIVHGVDRELLRAIVHVNESDTSTSTTSLPKSAIATWNIGTFERESQLDRFAQELLSAAQAATEAHHQGLRNKSLDTSQHSAMNRSMISDKSATGDVTYPLNSSFTETDYSEGESLQEAAMLTALDKHLRSIHAKLTQRSSESPATFTDSDVRTESSAMESSPSSTSLEPVSSAMAVDGQDSPKSIKDE